MLSRCSPKLRHVSGDCTRAHISAVTRRQASRRRLGAWNIQNRMSQAKSEYNPRSSMTDQIDTTGMMLGELKGQMRELIHNVNNLSGKLDTLAEKVADTKGL